MFSLYILHFTITKVIFILDIKTVIVHNCNIFCMSDASTGSYKIIIIIIIVLLHTVRPYYQYRGSWKQINHIGGPKFLVEY